MMWVGQIGWYRDANRRGWAHSSDPLDDVGFLLRHPGGCQGLIDPLQDAQLEAAILAAHALGGDQAVRLLVAQLKAGDPGVQPQRSR
jgi:hypothetical protein